MVAAKIERLRSNQREDGSGAIVDEVVRELVTGRRGCFPFNPASTTQTKMPEIVRWWEGIKPDYAAVIRSCIEGQTPWPLVLVGPAGVGKTCAALCVLDMSPPQTLYRTADQAAKELIAAMKGELLVGDLQIEMTELDWWNRWRDAECVVLDEIGQRNPSDHAYETIKRCIDGRRERPAVICSNVPLLDLAAVYDERVYSRLNGGTVIEMAGDDRRGANGEDMPWLEEAT